MLELGSAQEGLALSRFAPRQKEVLVLLVKGYTRKQMAEMLGISLNTVGKYISGDSDSTSERMRLGIKGIVETVTGKRPTKKELIELFGSDSFPSTDLRMWTNLLIEKEESLF